MLLCLQSILQSNQNTNYIILSDSLRSLKAPSNSYLINPIVQRILLTFYTLSENKKLIIFIWLPAHMGEILHCDAVDVAAKEATHFRTITNKTLPTSNDINRYQKLIRNFWYKLWKETPQNNKLK